MTDERIAEVCVLFVLATIAGAILGQLAAWLVTH